MGSVSLEKYIRQVYLEPDALPSHPIFSASEDLKPPTLQKNCLNYILHYRGCFNPPHKGHLQLLSHALFRMKGELNIRAAIMECRADDSVRNKLDGMQEPQPMVLPWDQRVKLWNDPSLIGGLNWVIPSTDNKRTCKPFRKHLIKEAGKDGFAVEFITLMGSDYLSSGFMYELDECNTYIVGGGNERGSVVNPNAPPQQIPGYGSWSQWDLDKDFFRDYLSGDSDERAVDKLCKLYPNEKLSRGTNAKAKLEELLRNHGSFWICIPEISDPGRASPVYYLPFETTSAQEETAVGEISEDFSSTKIRSIIRGTEDKKKLRASLAPMALSVDELIQFLEEDGFWPSGCVVEN